MKKTFDELLDIDIIVGELYKNDENLKKSKFGYAYKRFFVKNIEPTKKEYNEEVTNIRIDNALEDEKTKELKNDPTNIRGFKYSKEGLKKCVQQENELLKTYLLKEIEVQPYISSLIPEGLTEEARTLLTGVLI